MSEEGLAHEEEDLSEEHRPPALRRTASTTRIHPRPVRAGLVADADFEGAGRLFRDLDIEGCDWQKSESQALRAGDSRS